MSEDQTNEESGEAPESPEIILQSAKRTQAYGYAIELLKYEGEMLWVILSACMVVNVLLVGIIAQTISGKDYDYIAGSWPCVIGAFFGLMLSIAWYGTFLRNSDYYHFRMDQAKKLEDPAFPLLNGDGEKFANGEKITLLNGKKFGLNSFSRLVKNKRAGHLLILSFFAVYLLVLFQCWPHEMRKDNNPIKNCKTELRGQK